MLPPTPPSKSALTVALTIGSMLWIIRILSAHGRLFEDSGAAAKATCIWLVHRLATDRQRRQSKG